MSLLQLRNVSVLSPRPLFRDLSLTIHETDRVGVVAGNGAGKTTLLRCIARQLEPTSGTISHRRGSRVAYVEQDVPDALRGLPLREALRRGIPAAERDGQAWKVDLMLDTLEVPGAMRSLTVGELSGGWQRLATLARASLADPDVLLLDEPTNHLDARRLEVLETWLRSASDGVAMVIASHDRQFLDNCTNRTLFLRPDVSVLHAHPFSRARELLADDDAAREAKLTRDTREVDRLRRNAGKLRNVGINSGSDLWLKKAKYLNNRADAIEQSLKPRETERAGEIRLANRGTHARVLLSLENVPVAAPDGRVLFRTGTLKLFQGDRVVVTGANGVGKSMFIRLLRSAAEGVPAAGVAVAASVAPGYIDQAMSQLPSGETPFALLTNWFRPGDQRAISLLAGAGFSIEAQRRPISSLSPGQKARLGLLALRLSQPNLYLLDEPTNHMDIHGRERLEEEILAHGATCVLVSHDRFFTRAIATRSMIIANGTLRDEPT
jgi:ATPase subunit of ABC transporter with duplicated ATPase domains